MPSIKIRISSSIPSSDLAEEIVTRFNEVLNDNDLQCDSVDVTKVEIADDDLVFRFDTVKEE